MRELSLVSPPRVTASRSSAKLIGRIPSSGVGRAEVAQSGTARVWKARGGIRLGSSNAADGRTVVAETLPLGAPSPLSWNGRGEELFP